MRSVRVLSVLGLASIIAAVGCSSAEPADMASTSQALGADPVLNEVSFNPPSTDNPYEYIELKGTPGASLTGYQVLYLEGDAGASLGVAKLVFSLSGATIGANGTFVLKSGVGGHTLPAGANQQADNAFDATNGGLENGTGTFLLVKGATFLQSTDYDTNDDGTLDLPVNGVVVDAIASTDGGSTDRAYGPIVALASGGQPGAVTRFSDDDRLITLGAWYGGIAAGAVNTGLLYDVAHMSSNAPSGAPTLTPGDVNYGTLAMAGDGGTPAVDAGAQDSGAADAGAVDSGAVDASFPVTSSDPYLNEIEFNPGGTDNPYEYIELKGVPGASLTGYQVVYFEGDAGSSVGVAKLVFSLTGATFGSSGFLVLKSNLGGHTLPAGCNLQSDNAFDVNNGALENGTGSFVLLRGATLAQGTDYDATDDGVLDLPAGAVVVDAVAVTDNGSTDKAYGPIIKNANGSEPAAISRLVPNVLRADGTAWFGATLSGVQSAVVYDASVCTANMPANAVLTPGAENSQGSATPVDAGTPVVDAGTPDAGHDAGTAVVDAGPRDAGAPVVDAGPRDSGTAPVDAGTAPVDAGTKVDAGAKADAATPAEQTFGDNESKSCSCTVVGSTRSDSAPFAWVAFAGFMSLVAARRRR